VQVDGAGVDDGFPGLVIVRTLHVIAAVTSACMKIYVREKCAHSKNRFKWLRHLFCLSSTGLSKIFSDVKFI
jgi:hypothetical protein